MEEKNIQELVFHGGHALEVIVRRLWTRSLLVCCITARNSSEINVAEVLCM